MEGNSLRDDVKDALKEYIEKELSFCDSTDTACNIADIIFEVLNISDKEQDATDGGYWTALNLA